MSDRTPRPGEQHPDAWRQDLNPDAHDGQNRGADAAPASRTAYDLKDLHRRLADLSDDLLKDVPVLDQGARLQQGATYIDLADARPREFTATGDMEAGAGNCYVAKSDVDYELWNRLIGVTDPERLGRAG